MAAQATTLFRSARRPAMRRPDCVILSSGKPGTKGAGGQRSGRVLRARAVRVALANQQQGKGGSKTAARRRKGVKDLPDGD